MFMPTSLRSTSESGMEMADLCIATAQHFDRSSILPEIRDDLLKDVRSPKWICIVQDWMLSPVGVGIQ